MNGININIPENDFKNMNVAEQNWLIFKAIEVIDRNGCRYGRQFHHKEHWSKLVALAGAFGGALGAVIGYWAFICR